MRRFFANALVVGMVSTACWSALAEPNELNCTGLTTDLAILSVAIYQDFDSIKAKIQYGKKIVREIEGLETLVTYRTQGHSTLHFGTDLSRDVITVQRVDSKDFALHFRFPELAVGTLKTKLNDGETRAAFCTTSGEWAKKLEEVVPEHIQQITALLKDKSNDTLVSAITLAHNANYPAGEKQSFYEAVFREKNVSDEVKTFAAAAAFSEQLSASYQNSLLDQFQSNPKILANAAESLANCSTCDIDQKVFEKIVTGLQFHLSRQNDGVDELWYAVGKLSFQKRNQMLAQRRLGVDLVFSNSALGLGRPEDQLAQLAEVLLASTQADQVSSDAQSLLLRIANHPLLKKSAAAKIGQYIIQNHANQSVALPSLPADVLLSVIDTLERRDLLQAEDEEKAWLKAEALVAKTRPEDLLALIQNNASDFAMIENVLQAIADQPDAVPNGKEIVVTILTGLKSVSVHYLQFNFENQRRGVLPALFHFAFSPQAQALQNGTLILTTILTQKQISNQLLQAMGSTVADSANLSQMESEQLFAAVVNHPNYIEIKSDQSPKGLVTGYLEQAINTERFGSKTKSKFSVPYLNWLLHRIVAKHRLNDDDMEKRAAELIEQTDSI